MFMPTHLLISGKAVHPLLCLWLWPRLRGNLGKGSFASGPVSIQVLQVWFHDQSTSIEPTCYNETPAHIVDKHQALKGGLYS
jgi:hypothetical protein